MRSGLLVCLLLVGCGSGGFDLPRPGSGPEPAEHFSASQLTTVPDIADNPHVQRMLANANITIHTGSTPPNVEGSFDVDIEILRNDVAPFLEGERGTLPYRFIPRGAGRIDIDGIAGTVTNAHITGAGEEFTIWWVTPNSVSGRDCNVTAVAVLSDTIDSGGDFIARLGETFVGWIGADCDREAADAGLGSARGALGITVSRSFDGIYMGSP